MRARERANDAFAARAWAVANSSYAEADAGGALDAADLERWGLAAYLVGQDEISDAARERAHHAYLEVRDVEPAVRVGHWLGVALVLRGEVARSQGWFGRVQTLLDQHGLPESVWHLYLRVPAGMGLLFSGQAEQAVVVFEQILRDAARFPDEHDLLLFSRNGLGQALVKVGRVSDGLHQLDEVMVGVTTSAQVSPQVVGLLYCAVIDTCRRSYDLRRAREWTEVLSRWCDGQPDLVPFRGQCLVHRAEVLQLHGCWPDASEEVERVFARLGEDTTDMAAGMAHYQRGELHRLRGEAGRAEQCYQRSARCGRDPQPGLALLRATQGDIATAYAAIRRAAGEQASAADRMRLLPAFTEIALAAGDVEAAAAAAAELRVEAATRDVPLLSGAAAHAEGRIALARGDAPAALQALRTALATWQSIGVPYEAAATRVHLAIACRELGDHDTATLELDAARWTFEQLGAAPDLARVQALSPPSRPAPGGLTAREAQVLRLVATGATNRLIAAELFLSEKTVARHVANIFIKLGVPSRSAATAFAYEHHLV